MNSRVNKRTDKYADGMVLVEEILNDVRQATGPDFIVGIRLGVFEPGLAEGIDHAKRLAELGIDFLDLSYGFGLEDEPEKPEEFPLADVIYGAGCIKTALKEAVTSGEIPAAGEVPVFAVYGSPHAYHGRQILSAEEESAYLVQGVLPHMSR